MSIWKKLVIVACALLMLVSAFGCKEEGPAEKAGKSIDQAVDNMKDQAKKLLD
ncbi:hypothetical protein GGQ74_003054 [Desulfobaculum xiamenense]|uniref:Transport-associated protein n=1 Tax=Desulfobaculum xiamenense TaxID=995050 RepID=A0A846QS38_9BACT|nr:transport-associated protein [Desulfobaculum xiamenense]NJB69352.1 hypothetical protein [Desulfobaculum xiamenense]